MLYRVPLRIYRVRREKYLCETLCILRVTLCNLLNVFCMVCFVTQLNAQDATELWSGDTLRIEEVIISNNRKITETGILISQIDSLVMDEKAVLSLSETLAEHSPVFIKTYGRGALATASFRGTAPSHTKVTWNGMEINSPMLGMTDFSLIPVYFADEITLYPGPGSMKETAGALGGLISLNTKPDQGENFSGQFIQGIGSYGTWDNFLKFNLKRNKLQSTTRIFYSRSDNDFSYINRDVIDSVDLETGSKFHPLEKNRNAGYEQYGVLQELFYRYGNRNMLKLSFWGQQAERSIPNLTTNESGAGGGISRQNDDIMRLSGSWKHYGEKMQVEYRSGLNIQQLSYEFIQDISGLGLIDLISSDAQSVSFINKVEAEYQTLRFGVIQAMTSWTRDNVNTFESVARTGYDQQRDHASLLVSWSNKWQDKIRTGLSLGEELAGERWSPLLFNLSGEYHLLDDEKLYLRGSLARNMKFPGLNDLFYQPGGNPLLKHETGISREAGLHWKTGFSSNTIDISVGCYFTDVNNWILWLPTFKGYWEPQNIHQVEVKGMESSFILNGYAGAATYRLRMDYTYTSSTNRSKPLNDADLSTGKQLPFIPMHSANTMLNLSRKGWSLTWLWNYFSERYINSSNDYHSKRDYLYPYYMNQLTAGKSLSVKKYRAIVSLNVHNLFNEEYRSILQRPMPGRNFSLMIKINY